MILYHLGLGAGDPPTDPDELEYTYEDNLKVLPSFGVIPVFGVLGAARRGPRARVQPGHAAPRRAGPRDPPAAAHVGDDQSNGRVVGVYDKGKAALVVVETDTDDEGRRRRCSRTASRCSSAARAASAGTAARRRGNEAPDRAPDHVVESPTLPQQALLYRLSGDKNPLHADPGFAKLGGFDAPILHGLCSFGIVCKAVVDEILDGDVTKVARYQVRFAGVVFPGETIVTSVWRDGDDSLLVAGDDQGARQRRRSRTPRSPYGEC